MKRMILTLGAGLLLFCGCKTRPVQQFPEFPGMNVAFRIQMHEPGTFRPPQEEDILSSNMHDSLGGYQIGVRPDGGWFAVLRGPSRSDGTPGPELRYEPTVERQPIRDSTEICLSYNQEKEQVWLYYNDEQVAIYNVAELGGLNTKFNAENYNYPKNEYPLSEVYREGFVSWEQLAGKPVWKQEGLPKKKKEELKILAFNIWNGGRETGDTAGVRRVVDVIRNSGAEMVGIIETYGSGPKIADALGYYFYLHSSNLSIMSRYPIVETADFFKPFNCSAAKIQISEKQTVNYINLWLHYLPSTDSQLKDGVPVDSILRGEWSTRAGELRQILTDAEGTGFIAGDVPTFVSGDFNIASHLDWTDATKDIPEQGHRGYAIPWPTSELMLEAGFTDAYRTVYPDPVTHPGQTWSTKFKDELQYRIDFIYFKGPGVTVKEAMVVDNHPELYPSDHAAVLGVFGL